MSVYDWIKGQAQRLRLIRKPEPWPDGMEEVTVEEMHASRERGIQLSLRHPLFVRMACDLGSLLEESGAPNYVEYQVYSEKCGPLSVLIQRLEGETPAQQNAKLRKQLATLIDLIVANKPLAPAQESGTMRGDG